MKKLTQKQRILKDLQKTNDWIPATHWWDAQPRIIRVASRIHDLRSEGYEIETRNKRGYAEYKLIEE